MEILLKFHFIWHNFYSKFHKKGGGFYFPPPFIFYLKYIFEIIFNASLTLILSVAL